MAIFKSMAPIKRPLSIRNTSPIAKNLSCLHCAAHDEPADIDKGMQNLDIPLLEKTVKQCEEMAKKDSKDYRIFYYGAKAHFAIADCLDIKSGEEFDLSGTSDEHLDQALDLIKVAQGLK